MANEPVIKTRLEVTPDMGPGLKEGETQIKNFGKEVETSLDGAGEASTRAGGSLDKLSEKLREHKSEHTQAARQARFFTKEIAEITGRGSEASIVLGKLAGGLAAGGGFGLAMAAAQAAIHLVSKELEEQKKRAEDAKEALKALTDETERLQGRVVKQAGELQKAGAEEGEKKIYDLQQEIILQQRLLAGEVEFLRVKEVNRKGGSEILEIDQDISALMQKEKAITSDTVMERQKGIDLLRAEMALLLDTTKVEKEREEVKAKAKQEPKDELRALNFMDEVLAKQQEKADAARQKEYEELLKFNEKKRSTILALENQIATAKNEIQANNQKMADEREAKAYEATRLEAKRTADFQIQAQTAVVSAFATGFTNMVLDSKNAGKHMLKALVQSIRGIVMAYAAQASAAAMAANSGIPVVGFAVGTAAAGAAFAFVEALVDKIPSARGGYDVPTGINPLTQLHENEMVLPATIAQPLRQAVSAGGLGGATFNINAMDGASVRRVVESADFAAALSEAVRNGRIA